MSKKLNKDDYCWCKSGEKYEHCHYEFDKRISIYRTRGYTVPPKNIIKNKEQIKGIKDSCKVNIEVLDRVSDMIKEGISTLEIDDLVYQTTTKLGGICAPFDFHGYPKNACVSINEVVCHGIPSDKVYLKDGDIVNVDVSTCYGGYFSDSSRMFCIGDVSDEKRRLVEVTKECMEHGVEKVKPWAFLGDVSSAIYEHAFRNRYSVVREIGGHGIGLEFHEKPFVSHVGKAGTGMLMVPGMVFTIEPMVNMGKSKVVIDTEDGWTVYTADRKPSAQWEVSVLVTEEGHEVLAY